jgi:hypothetical protein
MSLGGILLLHANLSDDSLVLKAENYGKNISKPYDPVFTVNRNKIVRLIRYLLGQGLLIININ